MSALVLLALLAVAGGLFLRRAHLLYRIVRLGRPANRGGESAPMWGRGGPRLTPRRIFVNPEFR